MVAHYSTLSYWICTLRKNRLGHHSFTTTLFLFGGTASQPCRTIFCWHALRRMAPFTALSIILMAPQSLRLCHFITAFNAPIGIFRTKSFDSGMRLTVAWVNAKPTLSGTGSFHFVYIYTLVSPNNISILMYSRRRNFSRMTNTANDCHHQHHCKQIELHFGDPQTALATASVWFYVIKQSRCIWSNVIFQPTMPLDSLARRTC